MLMLMLMLLQSLLVNRRVPFSVLAAVNGSVPSLYLFAYLPASPIDASNGNFIVAPF